MISAPYLRSCSTNNMTSSSIDLLQDMIVHRNQTNDWISQLSAAVTTPLCPPQPLTPSQLTNATSCSSAAAENYFRRGLSLGRSLSTPEPKNWNESLMTSSDDFRSPKVGKSERYKTELCRSFEETGFCKYKEKCQFAHGSHELRNVQRHPKYKTDRCRTYHSTGFCPYGSRCHFVHDEQAMMMNRAPVGYGAAVPPPPPLELSTRSSPELVVNDLLRSKANDYEGRAVLPDQMNQLLEALSRAFLAVSSGGSPPSHGSSSPSPTLSSFEVTGGVLRQDSLASGSVRSSPERLPTPTSAIRDDYGMTSSSSSSSYSRFSSCSNDYDVCGGGSFQSPVVSPTTTSLYPSIGNNDGGSSSAFSNIWARTASHPFSTLFEV